MKVHSILLVTVLTTGAAMADADPPGRAARVNFLSGPVSFQPAGVDDWTSAMLNRPLTTGDKVWTDEGASAEMHIGSAALRLSGRTGFSFLNLDDRTVQAQVTEGTLIVRLRRLEDDESFEVDTPNLAFSLLRAGEYRIDVNLDRQVTTLTVRSGEGEATGGGQAFTVHARERAEIRGDQSLTFDVYDAPAPDGFDNWAHSRDLREDRSESARYVSRDMIGYEDLDEHGSWRDDPAYGHVWAPRDVPVGWAPYRYGHWAWIEPWGWTWVDDARWGFAPFHYGRWAYIGGGWAWVPGPIMARPVYAPALVAWVGGPRFSLSISIGGGGGGVGWFPLGPREAYVPAYRASPAYVTRVNNTTVINNVNVTNVYNNTTVVNNTRYVNQNAPGAVTAVPQGVFAGGRSVSQAAVNVPAGAAASAQVTATAAVAPSRESVLGRGGSTAVARPPAASFSRPVVARATPPPQPVPFAARRDALAANPGRPLDTSTVQNLQRTAAPQAMRPMVRQAPPVRAIDSPASQQPVRQGGFPADRAADPIRTPQARPDQARPDQVRPVPQPVQSIRPQQGVAPQTPVQAERPQIQRPPVERPVIPQNPTVPVVRPQQDIRQQDVRQAPQTQPAQPERPQAQRPPVDRPVVQQERPVQDRSMQEVRPQRPDRPPAPPPARVERPVERPVERVVERPQPEHRQEQAPKQERAAPKEEHPARKEADKKEK